MQEWIISSLFCIRWTELQVWIHQICSCPFLHCTVLPACLGCMYAAGCTVWIYSYHHTKHSEWRGARKGDLWTRCKLNLTAKRVGDQARGGWLRVYSAHSVSVTVGTIRPQRFWEGSLMWKRDRQPQEDREKKWKEKNSQKHTDKWEGAKKNIFLSAGWESELMHRHRLALANKLVKVRDSEDQK